MSDVKFVRIWLENCELVELNMSDFAYLDIRNVASDFRSYNDGAIMEEEYHAYGGVYFAIKANVKNGRWLSFYDKREFLEDDHLYHKSLVRLKANDITSIELIYNNGESKEIRVPWEPKTVDCVDSFLQSTKTDEKGRLVVSIAPKKDFITCSIGFNKKKSFSLEQIYDMVCDAYDALHLSDEKGISTLWQGYDDNEGSCYIKDLFDSLSQSAQQDFEKRLETIAREQGNKLSELDNLNEADYPTLDDFLSAREEIRDAVKKAIEADFEDFLE
jgi:hypothetical protein